MPISDELIAQLLEGCSSPDDILGEEGLLKQLTKKVAERARVFKTLCQPKFSQLHVLVDSALKVDSQLRERQVPVLDRMAPFF